MDPPSCVDPDPGARCESSPLLPAGPSQRGLVSIISTGARILSWWRRRRRERTEGAGIRPEIQPDGQPFVVPAGEAHSGDGKGFYFGAQSAGCRPPGGPRGGDAPLLPWTPVALSANSRLSGAVF